jgi:hypothetical protein
MGLPSHRAILGIAVEKILRVGAARDVIVQLATSIRADLVDRALRRACMC